MPKTAFLFDTVALLLASMQIIVSIGIYHLFDVDICNERVVVAFTTLKWKVTISIYSGTASFIFLCYNISNSTEVCFGFSEPLLVLSLSMAGELILWHPTRWFSMSAPKGVANAFELLKTQSCFYLLICLYFSPPCVLVFYSLDVQVVLQVFV